MMQRNLHNISTNSRQYEPAGSVAFAE